MTQRAEFKRISVDSARELLEADGVQVIDVRDVDSYSRSRIASARHVSDRNLGDVLLGLPKHQPVLIYCYHGNASQTFAQTFVDFGFAEVYSMDGGFEAWRVAEPGAGAQAGEGASAPESS